MFCQTICCRSLNYNTVGYTFHILSIKYVEVQRSKLKSDGLSRGNCYAKRNVRKFAKGNLRNCR